MPSDIIQEMDDRIKGVGDTLKNATQGQKDKIYQLAREHSLDPERVEEWPEEIKAKLEHGG